MASFVPGAGRLTAEDVELAVRQLQALDNLSAQRLGQLQGQSRGAVPSLAAGIPAYAQHMLDSGHRSRLSPPFEVPSTPDDDSAATTPSFAFPANSMDLVLKSEEGVNGLDFAELDRFLAEQLMAGTGQAQDFGVAYGGSAATGLVPEQQQQLLQQQQLQLQRRQFIAQQQQQQQQQQQTVLPAVLPQQLVQQHQQTPQLTQQQLLLQVQQHAANGTPVEIPDLLLISDQPVQFGRFRYKSEQRERSLDGEKSCPEVMVNPKYLSTVPADAVVSASLVTKTVGPDGRPLPHWHELGGNTASLLSGPERKARFENLVILIEKTNNSRVQRNKEDQRAVRIQFQISFTSGNRTYFGKVVSHAVYNAKLMINRLSHPTGPVNGGNSIILLCSKVRKACTTIRISERSAPHSANVFDAQTGNWNDGVCVMSANQLSFHHQFAIVFAMPAYHDSTITAPVVVDIEIIDHADKTNSQPVEYMYMPSEESRLVVAQASKKRKYDDGMNDFWRHFGLGGMGGMGGMGGDPSGGTGGGMGGGMFGGGMGLGGGFSYGQQHGSSAGPAMDVLALHAQGMRFFAHTGDARYLLAAQRGLIGMADDDGNTALHHAIMEGRADAAVSLASVAFPDVISGPNNAGDTPLHLAVERRLVSVVERLLECGADVSVRNAMGNNPLHLAARQPGLGIVERLVDSRVHGLASALSVPNNEGVHAAHVAVVARQPEALACLIIAGADINARDMCSGWTCLHYAAALGLSPIAVLLLKAGAKVSVLSHSDQTPLHVAAASGCVCVIEELLCAGASPADPDGFGLTPMDAAADLVGRPSYERIVLLMHEYASQGKVFSRMSSTEPGHEDESVAQEGGVSSKKGDSGDDFSDDYVMLPESLKDVKISDADLRIGKRRVQGNQPAGSKITRKLMAALGDDKDDKKDRSKAKRKMMGHSAAADATGAAKLAALASVALDQHGKVSMDNADGVSLMGVD